jgi:small conductance mechanosensitive channel
LWAYAGVITFKSDHHFMKFALIIELEKASKLIYNKLYGWLEAIVEMTPNLILAILILALFIIIGRVIKGVINKINAKIPADNGVVDLIGNLVFFAILTAGIFAALSILHLDKTVTSLLAGAGIVGLALGFAFQETAANLLSGVFMTFRKPISIGDVVETNGILGKVKELNLRATVLETPKGQNVIVPNKSVFYTPIINFSANEMRRVDIEVGVSYGENLAEVERVVLDAVAGLEGMIPGKDIELFYTEFGDSSINFQLRLWTADVREYSSTRLRSDAIKAIKAAFDQNGITIPFPIRTLDFGIKGGSRLDQVIQGGPNMKVES